MKKYLLVGFVLFSNCAFALLEDEEARKKINEMQSQLNNIEKSLEFKINQKFSINLSKYNSKLNELLDSVAKLTGDVEVLQHRIKNSEERHKVLYQELNERISKLELALEEKIRNVSDLGSVEDIKQKIDPKVQPEVQPEVQSKIIPQTDEPVIENSDVPPLVDENIELDAYAEADALIRSTKYKEAFKAFDKFITSYPNSNLLSDAKYKLGYSQFALKNYNAAIKTYTNLIKIHSDSPIIPEAIYGIANCEIQLTRITKAKKTLRGLIKNYPQAEIIEKAKKRLKALESIKL